MMRLRRARKMWTSVGVIFTVLAAAATLSWRPAAVLAAQRQLTVSVTPSAEVEAASSAFVAVIRVHANPVFAGSDVTLSSPELYGNCNGALSWVTDTPKNWDTPRSETNSPSFTAQVDSDGNAIAAISGGPSCVTGKDSIRAELDAGSRAAAYASFSLKPAVSSPEGLAARPSREIEDDSADVALVAQLEFTSANASKQVTLSAVDLYGNCGGEVNWYPLAAGGSAALDAQLVTITLDRNGNGYVLVLAGPTCSAGDDPVVAHLNTSAGTTLKSSFTILSPGP